MTIEKKYISNNDAQGDNKNNHTVLYVQSHLNF